jgi:hypothetical protein
MAEGYSAHLLGEAKVAAEARRKQRSLAASVGTLQRFAQLLVRAEALAQALCCLKCHLGCHADVSRLQLLLKYIGLALRDLFCQLVAALEVVKRLCGRVGIDERGEADQEIVSAFDRVCACDFQSSFEPND